MKTTSVLQILFVWLLATATAHAQIHVPAKPAEQAKIKTLNPQKAVVALEKGKAPQARKAPAFNLFADGKLAIGYDPKITRGELLYYLWALPGYSRDVWLKKITTAQITYVEDIQTNPLPPAFFTGIRILDNGSRVSDQPFHVVSTDREESFKFLETYVGKEVFIVSTDHRHLLQVEWLRVLNQDRVVGVILGDSINSRIKAYATYAQEHSDVRNYLRHFTKAPILLGITWISHGLRVSNEWAVAFGEDIDNWDGFGITGVNNFNMYRRRTRQQIAGTLGIPANKPMLLYNYAPGQGLREAQLIALFDANFQLVAAYLANQGYVGMLLDAGPGPDIEQQIERVTKHLDAARGGND
jgi:hypothetical protein